MSRSRPSSRWHGFVGCYGWRAYALPILTVITVAALAVPAAHGPAKDERVAVEGRTDATVRYSAGFAVRGQAVQVPPQHVSIGGDGVACSGNNLTRLVLVDISSQHLWACEGQREVQESAVTTGRTRDHDQTPTGSWHVQAKQRDRYLVGPGYRDYVQYWVPFNGDFGLHDASWQTMPFGSADFTDKGSHGCVHLPTPTMKWVYRWARVGRTVVTVQH